MTIHTMKYRLLLAVLLVIAPLPKRWPPILSQNLKNFGSAALCLHHRCRTEIGGAYALRRFRQAFTRWSLRPYVDTVQVDEALSALQIPWSTEMPAEDDIAKAIAIFGNG